jgi:uncharacterized membrane protein
MGRFLLFVVLAGALAYFMPAPAVHQEASIQIEAGREKTWLVLSDFGQLPRWNSAVHGMKFVRDQHNGQGTKISVPGNPISHTYELVSITPYNRMELRVTTDPKLTEDQVIRYTIHPRDRGTLVRFVEEYRVRGGYLGYAVDRVLYRPLTRSRRTPAMSNLKRLVESGQGLFVP